MPIASKSLSRACESTSDCAHQHLVGDAVVAGDDLVQDAVDVVARQRHDGPGVGERGVAGAADQPGIDQRDAGAGRAVALGARARPCRPPAPAADHQHVGVDQHAVELVHRQSPRPRPVLHRRMHVDDVLRAEDLAAEAGDAVLAELDHRQELGLAQPRDLSSSTGCGSMWITSAGQTTSQMPQPVHFSISMLSIMPLHSKCRGL